MLVKEDWLLYYINKRLNFSIRITSPVELVNRYLKSFIIIGNYIPMRIICCFLYKVLRINHIFNILI